MKINRRPDRMLPRALAIIGMLPFCDYAPRKDQKKPALSWSNSASGDLRWRWISQSQLPVRESAA